MVRRNSFEDLQPSTRPRQTTAANDSDQQPPLEHTTTANDEIFGEDTKVFSIRLPLKNGSLIDRDAKSHDEDILHQEQDASNIEISSAQDALVHKRVSKAISVLRGIAQSLMDKSNQARRGPSASLESNSLKTSSQKIVVACKLIEAAIDADDLPIQALLDSFRSSLKGKDAYISRNRYAHRDACAPLAEACSIISNERIRAHSVKVENMEKEMEFLHQVLEDVMKLSDVVQGH